jgi:hypothetical protein
LNEAKLVAFRELRRKGTSCNCENHLISEQVWRSSPHAEINKILFHVLLRNKTLEHCLCLCFKFEGDIFLSEVLAASSIDPDWWQTDATILNFKYLGVYFDAGLGWETQAIDMLRKDVYKD